MHTEPLLVPIASACGMLGISRSRLYEHIAAKRLVLVKDGAKSLITIGSIKAFAASLETGHAAAA